MRAVVVGLLGAAALFAAGAAGQPTRPTASPQTLVFLRNERAFLMEDDGSGQRRAPFPGYPVYSPNGRRVLYVAYNRDRSGQALFVANADGSRRMKLTRRYHTCLGTPDWSPDGTKIAYTLDCEYDFTSIWVVDHDGRHRRQLTGRWNHGPNWSPDGRTILFTSYSRKRGWRLYIMNADGRRRREIRGNYPQATDAIYQARWSRDGRRIYFLVDDTKQLFVMNRDGTGVRKLTPPSLSVGYYDLSPNQRLIAVHGVTRSGAARDIFVFEAGGSARQLTFTRGADQYPEWSPDGSKIAFESSRDGDGEIYVMNADGSVQTNLSRNPAVDRAPSWIPPRRRE